MTHSPLHPSPDSAIGSEADFYDLLPVGHHATSAEGVFTQIATGRKFACEIGDAEIARAGSWGIIGMRERALASHGESHICRLP